MRRLSARAFEMTAGARAWSPVDGAGPVGAADEASSQTEAYRQAYLEGFEAGFADGDKEAHRALEEAREITHVAEGTARAEEERWRTGLAVLAEQFALVQKEQLIQIEALAVTIAYASVCRLIGRMHAEHDLVAALCREALTSMHLEPTQLRVALADKASLEGVGLALPITGDPGLEPGDCVIETRLGGIEAGIEVQLRALLQALLETLGRAGQRP